MALRSAQSEPEKAEVIEENLEIVEKALDRVKVLYEQYFLGIQKQPPTQLHTDCERRLRDLSQLQIRNTALRYRFATLQQKFGSYNTYWRRTLRQIEQGKYHRNLSKIGRQAAQTGAEIPEEILAAMPKRMRDQVVRDREAALAIAKRRNQLTEDGELPLDDADILEDDDAPALIQESTELRRSVRSVRGPHVIDESDGDLDLDAFFAAVTNDAGPDIAMPPAPPDTGEIPVLAGPAGVTGVNARIATGVIPTLKQTGMMPRFGQTGMMPRLPPTEGAPPPLPGTPPPAASAPTPAVPPPAASAPTPPPRRPTPPPGVPIPRMTTAIPRLPPDVQVPSFAPSQAARPNPIAPGSSAGKAVPVESMSGPFPRAATEPTTPREHIPAPPPRPAPTPRPAPLPTSAAAVARPPAPARPAPAAPPGRPPPGMTDADVNALYAKYVKAKEMVGETAGPGAYSKLLKTINAQAPKIMEQYKAKGVDFSVVVKDNQVVIRAKPKS